MSWIANLPVDQGLAGILAANPLLAQAWQDYRRALWSQPHVPITVLELCRLRLAQLHGAEEQWQTRNIDAYRAGITETKLAALSLWHRDDQFDAAERASLELAEVYFQDPQMITDAQAAAFTAHFGEQGLVALIQALGMFDAQCRLALLLQLQ